MIRAYQYCKAIMNVKRTYFTVAFVIANIVVLLELTIFLTKERTTTSPLTGAKEGSFVEENPLRGVQYPTVLEPLFSGNFSLIGLKIPKDLSPRRENYEGVDATFCTVGWDVQKQRPDYCKFLLRNVKRSSLSHLFLANLLTRIIITTIFRSVPRYEDVIWETHKYCRKNSITMDLGELMKAIRLHDEENPHRINLMKPSGIVYHNSRCGSTLTANMLTVADPIAHRVYSEPLLLLRAMASRNEQLVEDVLYLMGRSNDLGEKHFFIKMRSTAVRNMQVMPQSVKWIYLYRRPEEIFASHFVPTETSNIVCLKGRSKPHKTMTDLANEQGLGDMGELTNEEFCAVRLVRKTLMMHGGCYFVH